MRFMVIRSTPGSSFDVYFESTDKAAALEVFKAQISSVADPEQIQVISFESDDAPSRLVDTSAEWNEVFDADYIGWLAFEAEDTYAAPEVRQGAMRALTIIEREPYDVHVVSRRIAHLDKFESGLEPGRYLMPELHHERAYLVDYANKVVK